MIHRILVLAIVGVLTIPAAAQETKRGPQEWAGTIAPFVNESTLAVMRVDLTDLKIKPLLPLFIQALPPGTIPKGVDSLAELTKGAAPAEQWFESMRKAGGTEVYVLFSTEISAFIALVLPVDEKANPSLLAWLISVGPMGKLPADTSQMPAQAASRKGYLIWTPVTQQLKSVLTIKPAARPELAKAFEAAGEGQFQLAAMPTRTARKVLSERQVEDEFKPSMKLVLEMEWLAAGARGTDKPAVRLVIQPGPGVKAEAVRKDLQAVIGQAIDAAAKSLLGDRSNSPKVAAAAKQLLTMLDPQVKDGRVELSLDTKQLQAGAKLVIAEFMDLRGEAVTQGRMQQLSMLMKWMIVHVQEHKNQWPANLEAFKPAMKENSPGMSDADLDHVFHNMTAGVVYVRPSGKIQNEGAMPPLVLYTALRDGSYAVAYADGHVVHMTKAAFEKLHIPPAATQKAK